MDDSQANNEDDDVLVAAATMVPATARTFLRHNGHCGQLACNYVRWCVRARCTLASCEHALVDAVAATLLQSNWTSLQWDGRNFEKIALLSPLLSHSTSTSTSTLTPTSTCCLLRRLQQGRLSPLIGAADVCRLGLTRAAAEVSLHAVVGLIM